LTDKGLKTLGKALQGLHTLRSISLNFEACYEITGQGMKSLNEAIRRLRSLKACRINWGA